MTNISALQGTKICLSEQFFIKDLGEATYILEIKIYRDKSKRFLEISYYVCIDTILERYDMHGKFQKGLLANKNWSSFLVENFPETLEVEWAHK